MGVKKEDLETFLASEAPPCTIEQLLQARLIAPIPDSTTTYQLTDDARALPLKLGDPLNCHIQWYGSARSAVEVSGDLRARILELYDSYLAPDGKAVDYDGMQEDARFYAYVDATVELTKVDLSQLGREGMCNVQSPWMLGCCGVAQAACSSLPQTGTADIHIILHMLSKHEGSVGHGAYRLMLLAEKIAFFINVYNALIVHATVAHGVPPNVVQRLRFFRKANYVIGGVPFSADDMEHGVLRNNAVAPGSIASLLGIKFLQKNQFPKGDQRAELSVSPVDPRIHFALVCGAKSCPPIKLYTPENLDEGLQVHTLPQACK